MLPRNARTWAAIAAALTLLALPSSAAAGTVTCPQNESYTMTQGDPPLQFTGSCTGTGTIAYNIVQSPYRGTLSPTGPGSVTYTPNANFTGTDRFTYSATDSEGDRVEATVKITVDPAPGGNQPPICPDPVRVFVEEGGSIELVGNCVDPESGNPITQYGLITSTPGLAITGGDRVVYTPPPGTNTASFLYSADDGAGGFIIATVLITVVPAGTTEVSTGTEATPETPVVAGVQSPPGSDVTIGPRAVSSAPPEGYLFLGSEFQITAPVQTAADPLRLTFTIDGSAVESEPVIAFRDGEPVDDPCDGSGDAVPDPCVESSGPVAGGDYQVVILSSHASVWNLGYAADRMPATKDECKNGGWRDFQDGGRRFTNQGDCVSWVATRGANPPKA